MATPTTGDVLLPGGTSGMAPFPVPWCADLLGVGTTWAHGGTSWVKGRWHFQIIDQATGEVYVPTLERNRMPLTCPISGKTTYGSYGLFGPTTAFSRFGAAPNAGCVIWDAGTYTARIRYQNELGEWSDWANSDDITVAADSRTELHVKPSTGDDSNDGLSEGAAKATVDGALTAIAGDNYTIILHDDEAISGNTYVDRHTRSNVWVRRSYDGTNQPVVTFQDTTNYTTLFDLGNNWVLDGFEYNCAKPDALDGNAIRCNNGFNMAVVSLIIGACQTGVGSGPGLTVYGCTQKTGVGNAMANFCHVGGPASDTYISFIGNTIIEGTTSHVIRIVVGSYHDIAYCHLRHDGSGNSSLRWYGDNFLGVYRCRLRDGQTHFGDNDNPTKVCQHARWDCVTDDHAGDSVTGPVDCHTYVRSGVSDVFIANANQRGLLDSQKYSDIEADIELAHCAVRMERPGGAGLQTPGFLFNADTGMPVRVRGSLLVTTDAAWNNRSMIQFPAAAPAGTSIVENAIYKHSSSNMPILNDGSAVTTVAALNARGDCSGNVEAPGMDTDRVTGVVSGTTAHQGIVTDLTGVFESLTAPAGYTTEIDRTLSAWDAGPNKSAAQLVAEPSATPGSITGLSAGVDGQDIDLSWAVDGDYDEFEVQRSADGISGWTQQATPILTSWSDVEPGVGTHYYRVRAYLSGTPGDWSDVVSAEILAAPTPIWSMWGWGWS